MILIDKPLEFDHMFESNYDRIERHSFCFCGNCSNKFESNYDRIESPMGYKDVMMRFLFESNYDRIERCF